MVKGRLVLTRKLGESLQIGPDIRVTILDRSSWNAVRVAIEAPKDVKIDREEAPRDA